MSVAYAPGCQIRYRWCFPMIPWYRQLISMIYGIGVIMIALWALEQGQGPYVILGVVGMSMVTLMLIFGIEIDEIRVLDKVSIDFSNTDDRSEYDDE